MAAPDPSEELQYQVDFIAAVRRWSNLAISGLGLMSLVIFVMNRSWTALMIGALAVLGLFIVNWAARRARLGDLLRPLRLYIGFNLVAALVFAVVLGEELGRTQASTFGLLALIAATLDRPGSTWKWAAVSTGAYVVALVLVHRLSLPPLGPAPVLSAAITGLLIAHVALHALLGNSLTRHLRQALAASEDARSALARSNRALERQRAELQGFTYVVAHDLRAPLRAVTNYSRFLRDEHGSHLDVSGRSYIDGIAESAKRMDDLVAGLLEYARISRSPVVRTEVDVWSLLDQLVARLGLHKKADVLLPPGAPIIRTSEPHLEQIFTKLLDNAAKFHRPGVRPTIAIEWADRGDAWELAVRDNGIGIASQHFEKIFGVFQRLHTGDEYPGIGLGLAVVKRAVEDCAGTVWVESSPGEGSVFRFTLPKS